MLCVLGVSFGFSFCSIYSKAKIFNRDRATAGCRSIVVINSSSTPYTSRLYLCTDTKIKYTTSGNTSVSRIILVGSFDLEVTANNINNTPTPLKLLAQRPRATATPLGTRGTTLANVEENGRRIHLWV